MTKPDLWIDHIPYEQAQGRLRTLYDRIKGPDDNVDNIMLAHSLRPHTMEGHMTLYKYVMHHSANRLDKWYLEAIGIYVSMLNRCDYCIEHHFGGMKRLIGDDGRANAMRGALSDDAPAEAFDVKQTAGLAYAAALTRDPSRLTRASIDDLRSAGFADGEILEINQVAAYFNYANRTVLGLGITTDGDILGLSPNDSDKPDDWQHS